MYTHVMLQPGFDVETRTELAKGDHVDLSSRRNIDVLKLESMQVVRKLTPAEQEKLEAPAETEEAAEA